MRILHVHSGNIFGGVERIMISLAGHGRLSAKFQHVFAACFGARLQHDLANIGAEVWGLCEAHLARPWQILRARSCLRELLTAGRFDLAIVHSAWAHLTFTRTLQRANLPTLFWLHTAACGESLIERAARLYAPDQIISVSRSVGETAHVLFPGVEHHIVHAPILTARKALDRSAIRQSLSTAPNAVVILQASRMEPWKGQANLLRGLALLPPELDWRCWIAGGAESPDEIAYLESLKALAQTSGIQDRIQFLGQRTDVEDLMGAADIYCQPNLEGEGFSIAFVEACLAGLPIVTSAIGGAREMVDANNGLLIPPDEVSALTNALQTLIADEELRRALGSAGRRRALQRCDPAKQFAALEQVFLQMAA